MADESYVWVDLLYPPICIGCDRWLRRPEAPLPLCGTCRLEHVPLGSADAEAGGILACEAFEGPLAAGLGRLKLGGDLAVAGPLGRILATAPVWTERWDAVVPVPLHWRRALVRGFNQSALLVGHARRCLHAPPAVRAGWLRRTRSTESQRLLPAEHRGANVAGAFACPEPGRVRGARVLVVDDVATTGSTLRAAMEPLRRAGAAQVTGLALLRALA